MKNNDLILAIIFLATCVHIKASGLPLLLIAVFVFICYSLYQKKYILIFSFLAIALILAWPWLSIKIGSLFRCGLFQSFKLVEKAVYMLPNSTYIVRLTPKVLVNFISRRLLTYADWHLAFYTLIIFTGIYAKKIFRTKLFFFWLIIALCIFMIFFIFSRAWAFQWLMDGSMIERLVLHFAPLIPYFIPIVIFYKKGGELNDE